MAGQLTWLLTPRSRAAAPFQRGRHAEGNLGAPALLVRREDLQRKVRVRRTANLLLFVVDASWSVLTPERVDATKGAILSLLHDAYRKRDRVGLIVFRERKATLVLPPTSSVELAQRALADIPMGGKTPLSAALLLAYQVCTTARLRDPEVLPLLVLLTDGAGNISVTDIPPQEEVRLIAHRIRDTRIRAVVLNIEQAAWDQGLAQQLALALGAPYHWLPTIRAETLAETVRHTAHISA